jgi:hypothetical protein
MDGVWASVHAETRLAKCTFNPDRKSLPGVGYISQVEGFRPDPRRPMVSKQGLNVTCHCFPLSQTAHASTSIAVATSVYQAMLDLIFTQFFLLIRSISPFSSPTRTISEKLGAFGVQV